MPLYFSFLIYEIVRVKENNQLPPIQIFLKIKSCKVYENVGTTQHYTNSCIINIVALNILLIRWSCFGHPSHLENCNKPVNKDKGGLCASPSHVRFAHREMWVYEEKQKQKQGMTYIINLVSEDNVGAIDQESIDLGLS